MSTKIKDSKRKDAESSAKDTKVATNDMVMRALAKALGQETEGYARNADALDTRIDYRGKKIILPAEPSMMEIPTAINTLYDIQSEQETEVNINEIIDGYHYLDGLIALDKAMREVFGFTKAVTVRTFFGKHPPSFRSIQIGPKLTDVTRVLEGRFEIPNVEGYAQTSGIISSGMPVLVIQGETTKKFQPLFNELAAVTRRIVSEESIFREMAFEPSFDKSGNLSMNPPKFIDVEGAEDPIFSQHTTAAIQANVYNPILFSDNCRELGIPLKRGVLLEGPYGTGKTLVSKRTGQYAIDNGWTFIKLTQANALASAIQFARKFQPAVLFLEDIDEAMSGDDRNHDINTILNTIDGVDSKNDEVMVVFTSNHADNINQAMMRPGRLDAVIPIGPPDEEASLRLLQLYARNMLDPEADYTPVGAKLKGYTPAVIREAVERAKLYELSISEQRGKVITISPEALMNSADTMQRQLELLSGPVAEEKSVGDMFLEEIASRIRSDQNEQGLTKRLDNVDTLLKEIQEEVC